MVMRVVVVYSNLKTQKYFRVCLINNLLKSEMDDLHQPYGVARIAYISRVLSVKF
jgi:hypothetical protein